MMLYADVLHDQLRARLSAQQPCGLPVLIISSAVKGQVNKIAAHTAIQYCIACGPQACYLCVATQ